MKQIRIQNTKIIQNKINEKRKIKEYRINVKGNNEKDLHQIDYELDFDAADKDSEEEHKVDFLDEEYSTKRKKSMLKMNPNLPIMLVSCMRESTHCSTKMR